MTDWDSIQEANGFRVGDQVRARGPELGTIRNLFQAKGRLRARVHWPTVPFVCESQVCSPGSEQFVDLDSLTLAHAAYEQIGLFEAPAINSRAVT